MNKLITAALALAGCTSVVGFADEDYYRKMDAAADGVVEIENVSGEITVTGTDDAEVEVTGRIGDGVEEVVFERDGNVITIRVELESGGGGNWGRNYNGRADLEIRIPRGSDLQIDAVSADVEVASVDGRLDVESVSGSIEIRGGASALEITTMSGDVQFDGRGQTSDASLSSVSGDVGATNLGGEVHATSVSGDVELNLKDVSRLDAQSTSGDVIVVAALMDAARIKMETVSGDVELTLTNGRDGDYDLSSFSGDLENCFGPEAERRRYSPGRSLKFREGERGRDIRMSSMSGSVRVCD